MSATGCNRTGDVIHPLLRRIGSGYEIATTRLRLLICSSHIIVKTSRTYDLHVQHSIPLTLF